MNKYNAIDSATEEQFDKYLIGGGYLDPNANKNKKPKAHTLKATSGGPANFTNESKNEPSQKYAIVSIMGPQSSGKSTILNKLFGTRFEVMDHTQGRHQVTTGIWLGSCPKGNVIYIVLSLHSEYHYFVTYISLLHINQYRTLCVIPMRKCGFLLDVK